MTCAESRTEFCNTHPENSIVTDHTLPDTARVVVIGGGIIGCSVAYHLAEMGCTDVVLLERDQLTSGTTWHAAGLMTTYGSGSETLLGIRRHSMEFYQRLEADSAELLALPDSP